MRPFVPSFLLFCFAALGLSPLALVAQSPGPSKEILLNVVAAHTTPQGEHSYLYLRVFSDGSAECQASTPSARVKDQPTTTKPLAKDEFSRIKSIVDDQKLAGLAPKYETKYAAVDSWTEWKIEIHGSGRMQIIQVLEFSPSLAKTMKHPYPEALVELGCSVEKARAELTGETTLFDSKCDRSRGPARDGKKP
jgi:hypothetical protein